MTDDPERAFAGADVALLVGAMPRKAGMERSDLLSANGAIFTTQGRALAAAANPEVKVLVVGNPANTNALIAMSNAKGLDPANFTAMTRLDHNRAVSQLASRLDRPVTSIKKMTIWGNHSSTQYPDLFHCEVDGEQAFALVGDPAWVEEVYIPTVAGRGAAIIAARGASSAASAANAAISHVRDWVSGTPEGDWVSMGVPSDGSYGVPRGLISSFPCVCRDGDWQIVPGLDIDDYSRAARSTSPSRNWSRNGTQSPRSGCSADPSCIPILDPRFEVEHRILFPLHSAVPPEEPGPPLVVGDHLHPEPIPVERRG